MAHLTWSPDALRDINDTCEVIARTSGSLATALGHEIRAVATRIEANPRIGVVVPEYDRDDVREVQMRNFRLLYRLVGDDVEISLLTSVSRRLPRTPPG